MKVASGAHHTLALTAEGKVFGFGDPECGKIGRVLTTRGRNEQARKIEPVGARTAVDIFAGNQHSFFINKNGEAFAWGLNNHGQLGIGNLEMTSTPTQVIMPPDEQFCMIDGGEHHSIGLTVSGKVYCWGRNDESQCGIGNLYDEWRANRGRIEHEKRMAKEAAGEKLDE